jgi:hypothetical protein
MKNIVLACMTVNALIGAGTVKHILCVANQLSWVNQSTNKWDQRSIFFIPITKQQQQC